MVVPIDVFLRLRPQFGESADGRRITKGNSGRFESLYLR